MADTLRTQSVVNGHLVSTVGPMIMKVECIDKRHVSRSNSHDTSRGIHMISDMLIGANVSSVLLHADCNESITRDTLRGLQYNLVSSNIITLRWRDLRRGCCMLVKLAYNHLPYTLSSKLAVYQNKNVSTGFVWPTMNGNTIDRSLVPQSSSYRGVQGVLSSLAK